MTIRIGDRYWHFGLLTIEIGTRAGHKIRVRVRKFDFTPGVKFNVEGVNPYRVFSVALADIEYVRVVR